MLAAGISGAAQALTRFQMIDVAACRGCGTPAPSAPAHRFDEGSLYKSSGPSSDDINQGLIGDCYFLASMGAIADARPDFIEDAIQFNERTGNFTVTLHGKDGPVDVTVTQDELADNIDNRGGGGVADENGDDQAVWSSLMETAYAKLNDSDHSNGLDEGYDFLNGGGKARNAMEVLTGDRGTDITFSRGFKESKDDAMADLYNGVNTALENGRPVTLSTDPENRSLWQRITGNDGAQDGLVDNHVYVVESITENADGSYSVTLKNPWGHNDGIEGSGTGTSASITVDLETLVDTGGLEYFNAGPAN